MSYFDIAIAIVIVLFGLFGLWRGLVEMILSIVAMVIGFIVAYFYNDAVADWFAKYIPWGESARHNLAFVLLLVMANRVVGLIFWLINKLVGFLWRLPFINSLNRLLGMVVGVIEGLLVTGIVLAFVFSNGSYSWVESKLGTSNFAPRLIALGSVFMPRVNDTIKNISEGLKAGEEIKDSGILGN